MGDDTICRQMSALLTESEGFTVVGEASDGDGALVLVRDHRPDVLLLSLEALGSDGPETVAQVRALSPGTQVIVWNGSGQEHLVLEAFLRGALGHLVRGAAGPDDVIRAIRAVYRGEAVLSPALAGRILDEVIRGLREH
ncbi:MAG TPA: response regulator [Anaerolineae bacterium]|nr:response regulator [Anaerolineae bacterium]